MVLLIKRLIWAYNNKILEPYPYYLAHAEKIDKKMLIRY